MEQDRLVIKLDAQLKTEAKAVAGTLGVSLNQIIVDELRRLVRERQVTFPDHAPRPPRPHDIRVLRVGVTGEDDIKLFALSRREGLSRAMLLSSIVHKAANSSS